MCVACSGHTIFARGHFVDESIRVEYGVQLVKILTHTRCSLLHTVYRVYIAIISSKKNLEGT